MAQSYVTDAIGTLKSIPGLVPSHLTFFALHSSHATATFWRFAGFKSPLGLSLRAAESETEEGDREASILGRQFGFIKRHAQMAFDRTDESRGPKP